MSGRVYTASEVDRLIDRATDNSQRRHELILMLLQEAVRKEPMLSRTEIVQGVTSFADAFYPVVKVEESA